MFKVGVGVRRDFWSGVRLFSIVSGCAWLLLLTVLLLLVVFGRCLFVIFVVLGCIFVCLCALFFVVSVMFWLCLAICVFLLSLPRQF